MADATITDQLRRRFPPELEQTKPGRGSSGALTYVAGEVVIERLLDVLGAEWSWRVVDVQIGELAVLVRGEIVLPDGRSYHGVDAHPIFPGDRPQQVADALGNAVKSAETGALVRAARLLGVGLYLWRGGAPSEAEALAPRPATERQRQAIVAVARILGWEVPAQLEVWLADRGTDPDKLSHEDAQAALEALQKLAIGAREPLLARCRDLRQASSLSGQAFVQLLGGDPRTMGIVDLEAALDRLEEETP